jgi:hypothetical protein
MTGTVSVHHVEEGPPGAPVVVFSNSTDHLDARPEAP